MLKLAYIVSTFPKASETFVYREVLSLQAMQLNPELFACSPPGKLDSSKFTKQLTDLQDETFYLDPKKSFKAALLHPLLTLKIASRAFALQKKAAGNPNKYLIAARAVLLAVQLKKKSITHLHAHWPYSTIIGYLATRLYKCNYSVSIHAHEVAHENGHFSTIFPSLSFASFCNQAAMDYLLNSMKDESAGKKSHLIYHGVNVDQFSYLPFKPVENGRINIISAGRLTKTKGFDRLITACAEAKKQNINIFLTILGAGTEEQSMRELATKLDFTDNLDIAGWVPHDKVKSYMENTHLFALLADTTYHDGLPNVVLESMASGKPVIISPLPAAKEAVTHGKDGFILRDANDIQGFIECLLYLQENDGELEKMGKIARESIVAEHADNIHLKKMVDLFEQ